MNIIDGHALLGSEYHLHLEADELLARMDAHNVETAMVRSVGADLAVYNTAGNDRLLQAHPRLKALVSANPWYGVAALTELRRCRDLGAAGLFLHPSRQGFMPTDELVFPLLDWVGEAGWPVMFHTGTYVYSDILALGNVARRYPQTNFIAGFGGFTDMWFELPGVFAQVENLYLDASMMWGDAVSEIIEQCGAGRVLYGSAEPRGRYEVSLRMIERVRLPPDQLQSVLHDNARRIYGLT